MKHILLFLFCLLSVAPVCAQHSSKSFQIDSMCVKLSTTSDKLERLAILTDLSDLASGKKDVTYSKMLWDESVYLAHNSEGEVKEQALKAASAAMIKLTVCHLDNKSDSLDYYFDLARKELSPNDGMRIPAYYSMIRDVRLMQSSDSIKIKETLDQLLKDAKSKDKLNKYDEMACLYKLSTAALLMTFSTDSIFSKRMRDEFSRYAHQFYDKAMAIPLEEDFLFRSQALILIQNLYTEGEPGFLETNRLLLETYDKTLTLPDIVKRKYYSQRARIRCLATFAGSTEISQKERDEYYKRFIELIDRYPAQAPSPPAEFYRANVSRTYFELKGDYSTAIRCLDTVIKYTPYTYNIPDVLGKKAELLYKIGDYKQAFDVEKMLVMKKDSINDAASSEKYFALLDQYKVNETKLQQIESEQKYQLIISISIAIFLVIVIVLLIYVFILWRRAQQSDIMKSSFINSMCHEFRTPINVISGFSQVLAENENTPEEKKGYLATIHSSVKMLVNMLDDMLNIANVNSNSGKYSVEDVNLHILLKDELAKACDEFPNKKIECKLEPSNGKFIISSNKFYLHCIISNIINNAFKFSNDGTVTASYKMDDAHKEVLISITDQGKGIPADKHKYVFERFTKLDEYSQGAGLGLYVCKLLVSMLGGKISIDKEYTEGTKMDVSLPVKG